MKAWLQKPTHPRVLEKQVGFYEYEDIKVNTLGTNGQWRRCHSCFINFRDQAFKALSEAIKCNFDKWQLWENYLAICCDVGQFHEAISAYSRFGCGFNFKF